MIYWWVHTIKLEPANLTERGAPENQSHGCVP